MRRACFVGPQVLKPILTFYSLSYFFEGEFVAQFKFTVLLMPNGPLRITQAPVDVSGYESEKKIEDKDMLVSYLSLPAK